MKLHGKTLVLVPFFDSEGMKQWVRMQFNGTLDKRNLYNKVINYIKIEFGKTVNKKWVVTQCPMMNEYDYNAAGKVSNYDFKEQLETWITELEKEADLDEDKDKSDSVLQSGDNEAPGLQVQTVQSND